MISVALFTIGFALLAALWWATAKTAAAGWRHTARGVGAGLLLGPAFIHGHGEVIPVPCYWMLPHLFDNPGAVLLVCSLGFLVMFALAIGLSVVAATMDAD